MENLHTRRRRRGPIRGRGPVLKMGTAAIWSRVFVCEQCEYFLKIQM